MELGLGLELELKLGCCGVCFLGLRVKGLGFGV